MSDKICAVVQQPDRTASRGTYAQLSRTRNDMATSSSTARLEQRRAEMSKLQTTSQEFKKARSVVPRGTGRNKLWFQSGQYWGKAYTIGLILKHGGLPIADDDASFELRNASKQKRVWVDMQDASVKPPEEEQPHKKAVE